MSTRTFEHESDSIPSLSDPALCARLIVTVELSADSEDEGFVEDIFIEGESGEEISLESLPEPERASIEAHAQSLADEDAHENWYQAQIARAEAAWEASEDR